MRPVYRGTAVGVGSAVGTGVGVMFGVGTSVGVERIDDSALVLKFVVDVSGVDIYAGMRALNRDLLLGMSKLGVNVPYQRIDMRG